MNNQQSNPIQAIIQEILRDPQGYANTRCARCGGALFDRVTVIKQIPGTHPMNPTGKRQNLNLETFVCKYCGTLLDERMGAKPGTDEADA